MPNEKTDIIMSNTRALIIPGEMTMDRALELINNNHARTPLKPEQIYIFRMGLSNQNIDSYGTRMAGSSLNNYAREFMQGRALLNSHRSGGWVGQAELPIGRTFATELTGQFLPDDASYEATNGASLGVYTYMQRGLKLTDVSTDDIIQGIDGGTLNDVSVGFSVGDDGMYRCSICGGDMADWWNSDCDHIPGVQYDEGRAFAWVDNAHAREGSLVYMGATPGAMIDKAIRMVEAGKLSRRDAARLEEQWGARIIGDRSFLVGKTTDKVADGRAAPEPKIEDSQQKGVTAIMDEWEVIIAEVRTTNPALADKLAGLEASARPAALLGAMREQQGRIDALTPRATLGDQYMDDLVDQAVKIRVRAQGNEFDAEKYRTVLRATNDPAYIKAEIAAYQRTVEAVFGDGKRPTGAKGVQDDKVVSQIPYTAYKS